MQALRISTCAAVVVFLAALLAPTIVSSRIERSHSAVHKFVNQQACPSTGRHQLPCPGWIIDHVKALACGGADTPENMQWQTHEEAKAKDKWERKQCSPRLAIP